MINADFTNSSEVTTDRLYQWDIGQQLLLSNVGSSTAPTVHFCNKKSEKALSVASSISGDNYIANIPNSLLQQEYDLIAYIYVGDDEVAQTIKVVHIPLEKRLKPTTYTNADDEDVIDFLAITNELRSLLDGLIISEYDNTKTYKKPNIVYFMGCSYVCKSNTDITGIDPTNTEKWGLMCKNGANVSAVNIVGDKFTLTLNDGTTIDTDLSTAIVEVDESDYVALNITKDTNGVLKLGNIVIPQEEVIMNTPIDFEIANQGNFIIQFTPTEPIVENDGYNYVIDGYVTFDFSSTTGNEIPFECVVLNRDKAGSWGSNGILTLRSCTTINGETGVKIWQTPVILNSSSIKIVTNNLSIGSVFTITKITRIIR